MLQINSSVNKSKTKIFIIQQVDRKVDLEEIAETISLSFEDMLTEIENICYSGTKLNLNYYIDQVIDSHKQDDIHDYFMNADTDDIAAALRRRLHGGLFRGGDQADAHQVHVRIRELISSFGKTPEPSILRIPGIF